MNDNLPTIKVLTNIHNLEKLQKKLEELKIIDVKNKWKEITRSGMNFKESVYTEDGFSLRYMESSGSLKLQPQQKSNKFEKEKKERIKKISSTIVANFVVVQQEVRRKKQKIKKDSPIVDITPRPIKKLKEKEIVDLELQEPLQLDFNQKKEQDVVNKYLSKLENSDSNIPTLMDLEEKLENENEKEVVMDISEEESEGKRMESNNMGTLSQIFSPLVNPLTTFIYNRFLSPKGKSRREEKEEEKEEGEIEKTNKDKRKEDDQE